MVHALSRSRARTHTHMQAIRRAPKFRAPTHACTHARTHANKHILTQASAHALSMHVRAHTPRVCPHAPAARVAKCAVAPAREAAFACQSTLSSRGRTRGAPCAGAWSSAPPLPPRQSTPAVGATGRRARSLLARRRVRKRACPRLHLSRAGRRRRALPACVGAQPVPNPILLLFPDRDRKCAFVETCDHLTSPAWQRPRSRCGTGRHLTAFSESLPPEVPAVEATGRYGR